jgi:hypothetical protein
MGVGHVPRGGEAGNPGMGLLSGGMALFMLGDAFFRWVMGMRPIVVRFLGAALAPMLGGLSGRGREPSGR